ncbi:MAG: NAD-dependent epimerase/dehydratase family protein [Bacteroidota bacterium]
MKILIIGGTGFISHRVVDLLLADGHEVTTLTRRGGDTGHPRLRRIEGDRNDRSTLEHVAGESRFGAVYDMVAYAPEQSRIAAEVFRGRTRRFIHCSTISVYMVSRDVRCPIDEGQNELEPNWLDGTNPFGADYGMDKRACEDVLWDAHDEDALPVTMLRPTYVSGPRDPLARDAFWMARILDGRPILVPGSGDLAFHQVFVDDVARAFVDLLDRPATVGSAYNVASEEFYSLNEYLYMLAAMLDREPELVHVDQDVFDQLPFATYPGAHVFPFNTRRTTIFDLSKIREELDFSSTPLEEWMAATIAWYRGRLPGGSFGYEHRDREVGFADQWLGWRKSAPDPSDIQPLR